MMKIGLFTFGGGYAMIALLREEFVSRKKYLTEEEFLDMTVIAESTPGPIAINSATYIGYKHLGVLGSLLATLGVCIPSFVIIFAISLFFDAFLSLTVVAYAFRGIQAAVVYLIFSAGLKMLKSMKKTPVGIVIFVTVLALMTLFTVFVVRFSSIFYILASGIVGFVFYYLLALGKNKKENGGNADR